MNDAFSVYAIHPDGTASHRYASFPGEAAAIRYADQQAARLGERYKGYGFAVMLGGVVVHRTER